MGAPGDGWNAAAQGNPDWQGGIVTEDFLLLPAYGDARLYFALPRLARLARKANGAPEFFLEFVSDRNGAKPEESLYAMIDMGLLRVSDLASAYGLLTRTHPGVTLTPATFTTGTYWHLECDDAHETGPFAWEDAQRATIHGRISTKTGQLLYAALATGSITISRAAVECEMAAFLPRVDAAVRFNASNLLASVGTLNPGGASVPFQRMVTFFDDPPHGLLRFEGEDKSGTGRGLALAGRVRHYFGKAAPCPRISDGPHVALALPPGGAPETSFWDLRTPLMTGTPVFLAFDPFTSIVKNGERDRITAFTRVPMLPKDLLTERVTVASGLPRNIRNCDGVDLTLRVDRAYSVSGATAAKSVSLYPALTGANPVELEYERIGPKPYASQLTIALDGEPTEMPWFEGSGDYLYIGRDRLPGTCVTVLATPELLAQAVLPVAITGLADMTATLTADEPAASFLLTRDNPKARLNVIARDLTDAKRTATLDLPCQPVTLDVTSFREYGPRTVTVAVQFHDGVQAAQFEFGPESADDASIRLGFSAANASGQFSYFPTNIFRNRYRFRQAPETGGKETEWSEYQDPEKDLTIAVYRDGARIANALVERGRS